VNRRSVGDGAHGYPPDVLRATRRAYPQIECR
jgi:hypothetical protein